MSTQNAGASKERINELTQANQKLIEDIAELKKTSSRGPIGQISSNAIQNFDGATNSRISELESLVTNLQN